MSDKRKTIEETETTEETRSKSSFGTPEADQDVEYKKTTVKREEKEEEENEDTTVITDA